MNLRLALRMAWRDWRSGELGLLLAALLVAVGAVTAIGLFVDRLQRALHQESSSFLAADRYISGSQAIPEAFRREAEARGIEFADLMVFPSMVFGAGERSQLVSVKAAGPGYPLRGTLIAGTEPFAGGAPAKAPPPGEIWLDSRLFPALDVTLGDQVEVGLAKLKVSRVLVKEPDRGGSFFDLGPRMLMNLADVPATDVVQPGSRIRYRLLLRGPDAELEALREALPLRPGYRWTGIRQRSARIGRALDRAENFLLLGGLLAVLLAGVAAALSAHRYARRHYDHVAILKTLGATPKQVLSGYLAILAAIGLAGALLGLALGSALHLLILYTLSALIPVGLPPPGPRPLLLGAATGLICALAFAMPALLHLKNISPMRVMRRDLGATSASQWLSYGAAIAGSLFLLIWYSESLALTLWTLGGSLALMPLFGALALLLLRGGRALGMQAGSGFRLALSGLQRRRGTNTAQILIFGLAIMLLLILALLRTSLVDEWRSELPEDAPNHFIMNVTAEQLAPVEALLACIAQPETDFATLRNAEARPCPPAEDAEGRGLLYPMIRGRVAAVNGLDVRMWEAQRPRRASGELSLRSERNLTWTSQLPDKNLVVDGEWWAPEEERPLVSLEDEYAWEFGLQIGDRLAFDVGGQRVEAEIASLRKIDWESLQPNFFIIFSPAALAHFPATYMTSFRLSPERKGFLNLLLAEFPTVTVLEVDAVLEQLKSMLDRVTRAVELVLALVVAAACLVLAASIQAGRDARMAEYALVRTLGGARRLIAGSLAIEFAALGLFSGLVAAAGAELAVALLQWQIFDLKPNWHPWLWLAGPAAGALLILAVGMAGARPLIASPPMLVLRGME